MSRGRRLLFVSLPLAIVLTAACRFIQHTDSEYGFWVQTYGETAAMLEARCAALASPAVCARAVERRSLAREFQTYHDAVMAWWWPALLATLGAWLAALGAGVALAVAAWRRQGLSRAPPRESSTG